MRFNSLLSGAVWATFAAIMAASPLCAQDASPSPPHLSRGPGPDVLLLRGPGAQIGASFRDLTPAEVRSAASAWNWMFVDRGGVVIEQVRANSPASRAGLMKGDRITVFDGQRLRNAGDLTRLIEETPPGWTVTLTAVRDGKAREVFITPTL